MKAFKKISKSMLGVLVLSAAGVGALAGCSSETDDPEGYTYNTYLSTSPSKWNVHNWETNDESYIQSFTETGLYDVVLNKEHNGYNFISEMAADMPKNIDPTELDADEYDKISTQYYDEGAISKGEIWEIPLRKTAKWEDGTPITADDYVNSMERLLQPKYANYRADSYYNGNFVITNAEAYYKNGRSVLEPVYNYLVRGKVDGKYYKEDGSVLTGTGHLYLDLAKGESPYAKSIFSSDGSSDTITFYDLLNNRSVKSTDPVELAAKRITLGVSYYYWKFGIESEKANDIDKWNEIKKADSVSETMLSSQSPFQIEDFNSKEVYTCKALNSSETTERYTTELLKKDLKTFVSGISSDPTWAGYNWVWKIPLSDYLGNRQDNNLTMNNVGVAKVNDYTIRLYLAKPISELDLKFQLASNWLVKVDLYDSLREDVVKGVSWMTRYATSSVDNYRSYGPYKLTGFTSGKSITIERNDQWYGYTDESYKAQFADYSDEDKDQYKMTKIYTQIIKEHNTAVSEFMAGRLDDIDLNKSDMKTYGNSARRTTTLESYTQKITFNTDRDKLSERQKESGKNKTILANKNFRKGLSLGLNRNDFASQTTAGSKAFTGLLNSLYISNVVTGEMYRDTDQAKKVYNMIYGELGGNPEDTTKSALAESANGYNLSQAIYYIKEGIKEELKSSDKNHLVAGDTVDIEFRVYDNTSDTTKEMYNFISTAWSGLLKTASEKLREEDPSLLGDKSIGISVNLVKDEDYYSSARNGGFDMIFSIWGGAAIDPYGLMQVYLDKTFTNTCEYGFKGKQGEEELWIDLNGDGKADSGETLSFDSWYQKMNTELNEGLYDDDVKVKDEDVTEENKTEHEAWKKIHSERLTILAGTEAGIVNRFEAIPIVARGSSSLTGLKVENATSTYVNLVGYGGIRFLRFKCNNGEWSNFVSEHGGNLSDLYV